MFRILLLCGFLAASLLGGEHPNLILKQSDLKSISLEKDKYPLFAQTLAAMKKDVDAEVQKPPDVPQPKDAAGYTHETHKKNYTVMYKAGILYAIYKDETYAKYIKDMLLKYAALYPTLGKHPAAASSSPGRLFWQSLNEANWLFYTSQAYDCIYNYLSAADRKLVEDNVLRKIAEFFVEEREEEFNLIHNHGTWSCAAVGIAGMVLNDKEYVEKALYGTKKNKTGGFLRQLDLLISPDGFYTEGAYYARYAMLPFYAFAEALENYDKSLKIFTYREEILKKYFYTTMQQTTGSGDFLPINDAIKFKNIQSPEIAFALNVVYHRYGQDKSLLEIAKKQNTVIINGSGLDVAKSLAAAKTLPMFKYNSGWYSDGAEGNEGGLGILRENDYSNTDIIAVLKATAHGLSHGHYDKLSLSYFDQGKEVIQDYASARFINVDPKWGGRYLPENKSYAMQSIAHNTVIVDEKSHYEGKIAIAEKYHPEQFIFDISNPEVKVMSAKDSTAYRGVKFHRTVALVSDKSIKKPIIIDVFRVVSDKEHQYDMPFYYMGHVINTDFTYTAFDKERKTLGKSAGYQHLWKEAEGNAGSNGYQFSWLQGERFYTITGAGDSTMKCIFTRIGATDPKFNLRNEAGLMMRKTAKEFTFANTIEAHGSFDGVREYTSGVYGEVNTVTVISSDNNYSVVKITGKTSLNWILIINNGAKSVKQKHTLTVDNKEYQWNGDYYLIKK
ncbi:MAG: heparinase II/III family protein [Ignavibacteriales bacterium]|nr:heparinase II/III family protein [Ignavibacteriales bacterium]